MTRVLVHNLAFRVLKHTRKVVHVWKGSDVLCACAVYVEPVNVVRLSTRDVIRLQIAVKCID